MKASTRLFNLTALLFFAPMAASAQTAPTAEEIIARHVLAIGGREAVLKVTSIKTVGTMQIVAMGITANLEALSAAPNLSATKITVPGIGEISNGFDGSVAWEVNPYQGARVKPEKERAIVEEQADFYGGMLYPKERYQSCETVGPAEFGGEKTWQVKTVLKSGRIVNEFFSVASGLKVGSETKQQNAQGVIEVITVEGSYKQFGGLKLATRSETTTGPSRMLVSISSVELSEVPGSAFALPEAIKALVSKP